MKTQLTSDHRTESNPFRASVPKKKRQGPRILAALAFFALAGHAVAANGTWTQTATGGLWSTATNWASNIVADGAAFTADFNTIDITADNTVHLDSSRTLGTLVFGDATPGTAAGWVLDNNAGANVLTLNGVRTITVNALGTGKNATISANMTTDGTMIKNGTGELVLTGAYNFGTTARAITVNAGTLTIGANAVNNTINATDIAVNNAGTVVKLTANTRIADTGGFTVNAGATLDFGGVTDGFNYIQGAGNITANNANITLQGGGTHDFSGNISGSFSPLTINGNTVVLSGNNSYSGTTVVSNGLLRINSATAIGTSTLRFTGGTIDNNTAGAITLTTTNNLQLNGNFTFGGTQDLNLGTGSGDLNGSASGVTITTTAKTLTLGGVIAGGGTKPLTKAGAGTLVLGGNNTYTGATVVTAGTLQIGNGGATGSLSTSSAITNNGTLAFSRNNTITQGTDFASVIAGTGNVTQSGTGTLTLNGTNTYTGTTTIGAGTLSVGTINNGGTAGNLGNATSSAANIVFDGGTLRYTGANATSDRAFTINAGKTATIDTANNISFAGATGTATNGALTKTGAGVLTLTGTNTYTGNTTVSTGTLLINGSTSSSSAVTVSSAAILGGNGTVGGFTTVNGALNPGNSPGVLTFSSGLTLNGTTTMEINGSTPGTDFDKVVVTSGTTTLGGALAFSFGSLLPNNVPINLFSFPGTSLGNFSGVTSTGSYSGTWSVGVPNDTWTFTAGTQTLTFSEVNGTLNVVPEPATWAMLAFSLTTVMVLRRRRRSE